jgi:hypothetical protein
LPAAEVLVDPLVPGAATLPGHDANPALGGRQPQTLPESAPDAAGTTITTGAAPTQALDVAAVLSALKRHGRDPQTGRFASGHLVNLKHGRRAPQLFTAPALAEALTTRVEALERDYGGRAELTTAEHALVVELGRLQLLTEAAGASLMALGLTTTTGKARAACSLWLGLLDRQSRLAGQLGLSRRSKPAGDALTQWARMTGEGQA